MNNIEEQIKEYVQDVNVLKDRKKEIVDHLKKIARTNEFADANNLDHQNVFFWMPMSLYKDLVKYCDRNDLSMKNVLNSSVEDKIYD